MDALNTLEEIVLLYYFLFICTYTHIYACIHTHIIIYTTYTHKIVYIYSNLYRIRGLFGGDFNLAVWQIFIGLPNLNHAVLTRTHKMN